MKNYLIRAVVSAVTFTIVCLLLDLVFGNMHSFREYAVQAVIFGVLFGLFIYLDDKGRFDMHKAGLVAYSHGEYFELGEKLGKFGYSVVKKKKQGRKQKS